jgi:hypothetical protein
VYCAPNPKPKTHDCQFRSLESVFSLPSKSIATLPHQTRRTKWDLVDLDLPGLNVFGRAPTGTHHSSTAQARMASLSPHCSHSKWIVGFVNTIPDKKLPDSPKSRHGESSPGLWRMVSGSKNIRSPASKFGLVHVRWGSV